MPPYKLDEDHERYELVNKLLAGDQWLQLELIQKLSAEGLDGKLLIAAFMQLRDLEELRPGGRKRQKLSDALQWVEGAKRQLIRLFRTGVDLHAGTIRALEISAAQIRRLQKPWE